MMELEGEQLGNDGKDAGNGGLWDERGGMREWERRGDGVKEWRLGKNVR